jgi:membrane protease YdiL (CAAX protease family)
MSTNETTTYPGNLPKKKINTEIVEKAALFLLFTILGLMVFIFGTSYYDRFATNTSGLFKLISSGVLLGLAIISGRYQNLKRYQPVLYAFFVASFVNVITWYFAIYARDGLFDLLGISITTVPGMTAAKLSEVMVTVATILVLIRVSGDDLGSLFIRRGNLKWAMRIGVLALLNLTATGFMAASFAGQDIDLIIHNLPWFVLFALANGFMEELWFRGLFLGRLQPHIGEGGALWMTSIWFGVMHIFAVYVSGTAALIFGVVTITLGLTFALVMQKTKTIWGAAIFHSAADLHWFIAFGF